MKSKILSMFMAVIMAVLVVPVFIGSVGAADGDFTIVDGVITRYNGAGGDVVIPDGITGIGYIAFWDCTGLTSITIPDSVTNIGNRAFEGCTGLTEITIPDSVISIGDSAFMWCIGLTEITIPDSVTSIGNSAFWSCIGLTSITIPDGVTSIGSQVFMWCIGLTEITIPDSVTSIGGSAFENCTNLTSITIPDSVISIGDNAFRICTGLTEITIPNSVTSIGGFAFWGCTGLTEITIPDSVTSIGSSAFSYCTCMTEINVNSANTNYSSIDGVLFNKEQITLIQYPIGKTGSYTIPDSVTSIGISAFRGCTGLTEITIPDSVTSIGDWAFSDCTGLTTIYGVKGSAAETYATENGFDFVEIGDYSNDFVIVDGVLTQYNGAGGNVVIPDGVTGIGDWTFWNCTGLTSVTIPDSVTSIGEGAFCGCTGPTEIIIPDSVTSIGTNAFWGCTGLTEITIPDSVTSIGNWAFSDCTRMTEINVNSANTNYSSIDGVLFNKDITSLIQYPIGNTRKNYTIPDGVTSIVDYAFDGCTGLTSITIPDSVTSIGYKAVGYYFDYDSYDYKKVDNFTIYGVKGSAAETYATENGFDFVETGKDPVDIFQIDVIKSEKKDLVKIDNLTQESIFTRGMFLTDDENDLFKWQIPEMIIRPNDSILIKGLGDEVSNTPKRTELNFDIRLSENLIMSDADGNIMARW